MPLILREFNPKRAINSSMFRRFLGTVRRVSHVQSVSSLATPFISSGRNFRSASFTETTRTPCGSIHSNRSSSLSLCFSITVLPLRNFFVRNNYSTIYLSNDYFCRISSSIFLSTLRPMTSMYSASGRPESTKPNGPS